MARNTCIEKSLLIVLLLFLCQVISVSLQCIAGLETIGYTYPLGDIILEYEAAHLEITCVVDKDSFLEKDRHPSRRLHFITNNTIIDKNVIILNDTSIKLEDDNCRKGSSTIVCAYIFENNREAVCQNRVVVGTKPLDVMDFSCISYNYDNLTCSWTPPENYVKTKYSLNYTFKGRAGRLTKASDCPEIIETVEKGVPKMHCFWSLGTRPHYRQSQATYNFILEMTNVFGNNSVNYTFDHYKYVKSGPPEKLTAVSATTESINLTWDIPNSMAVFSPGLQCRILYQCVHGPKDWKLAAITYIQSKSNESYNLTGLHAHDLCDVRVALRSNKSLDESMWSTNSSITTRTASTVPGAPPRVNIGSFQVDKVYNMSKHDVYIYWQQIPEEIKNGEDFKYNVEVLGENNIRFMEITNSYAKYENLLVHREYRFAIWSENSEGQSVNKSFVTVPSRSNRPGEIQAFTKIAYQNGTFELNFEPPRANSDIKNFTIFWCKNFKDRPYQCVGYLNWTEVPSNMTHYNVSVTETNNAVWQFAISANTEKYSSGIVWASCTLLHSQSIGRIKQVLKIGSGSSDSIQLGWKLECVDRIPSIQGFIIYYCPLLSPKSQSCKGPERNVSIQGDASTTTAIVSGLKPYTTYRLNVAIKTKNGDISEPSDTLYETTLEGAPSEPLDLGYSGVTNSSIKIQWQPPDELNGALKYYDVQFNNFSVKVNPDTNPEYTLDNLESFKQYNITVTACTTACSRPSRLISPVTKMGVPGVISQPTISFQNNSFILVDWHKPAVPRGENNYYEVQIREKGVSDREKIFKINGTKYSIVDCGEGGEYNTLYFSVRAINIIDGVSVYGPWSKELECYCSNPPNILFWILLVAAFIFILGAAFIIQRALSYCKVMKNVELKLPPGLAPIQDWGSPKVPEEPEHTPSADEELLLEKITDSRVPSGDSSGCCSGHGSVASDSGTTLSNSSDSGTEQNELRKRSKNICTTPVRTAANNGYVTMPTEPLNKGRAKAPSGSYCILGIDPNTQIDPENTYISTPQPTTKLPYISCDAITPPSPYVLTGDLIKANNSGYVPLSYPELIEKNPAYVMAGTRTIVPEPINIKQEDNKPLYVQVSDTTKNMSDMHWQRPIENAVPKGYVTIGDEKEKSKKGYVPHRHFDAKLLKED